MSTLVNPRTSEFQNFAYIINAIINVCNENKEYKIQTLYLELNEKTNYLKLVFYLYLPKKLRNKLNYDVLIYLNEIHEDNILKIDIGFELFEFYNINDKNIFFIFKKICDFYKGFRNKVNEYLAIHRLGA